MNSMPQNPPEPRMYDGSDRSAVLYITALGRHLHGCGLRAAAHAADRRLRSLLRERERQACQNSEGLRPNL